MKFRKKPIVIEAIKWTGNNADEVKSFMPTDCWSWNPLEEACRIYTLEGMHVCSKDDWIIKGIKGEFYPCKPDIFEMTYEPVND